MISYKILTQYIIFSITIFVVLSSVQAQNNNYQIGGIVYDYNTKRIDRVNNELFIILDKNGLLVDYTNCSNPSTHKNLNFNLCLNNFDINRMPLELRLNRESKYAGRTILDLVTIQKDVVAVDPFTSFIQDYCADINQNEIVSSLDVAQLRKSIEGSSNFLNGYDYIMLPVNKKLDFKNIDFEIIRSIPINSLPLYDIEVIPYHQGDINGSIFSHKPDAELSLDVSTHDSIEIRIPNMNLIKGREYSIGLYTDKVDIIGHQIGIKFRDKAVVTKVDYPFAPPPYLVIGPGRNIGYQLGVTAYPENAGSPEIVEGKFLDIWFLTNKNCRAIDLFKEGIAQIPNRMVMADLSVRPIKFVVDYTIATSNIINSDIKILANPNPSSEDVRIDFDLPKGLNQGVFKLYNSLGTQIYADELNDIQQSHELIIPKDIFQHPGLYFGSLETKEGKQVIEIVRF